MNRDDLAQRCWKPPRLAPSQAMTLVRMLKHRMQAATPGADSLLTRTVAKGLGVKALVYVPMQSYKGMKSCCLTTSGARVLGLLFIAAQLAQCNAEGYRDTCFFCFAEWSKCTCPDTLTDDPKAPGFDFDGMWITDPKLDATGRFFVDPFVYYGAAYRRFLKEHPQ